MAHTAQGAVLASVYQAPSGGRVQSGALRSLGRQSVGCTQPGRARPLSRMVRTDGRKAVQKIHPIHLISSSDVSTIASRYMPILPVSQ